MQAPSRTRRRQYFIALGGLAGFVGLMVFGMWLSDPTRGKPTALEVRQERAQEVRKNFTAKSSDAVTAEESWIALSEKRLAQMQGETKALSDRLEQVSAQLSQTEAENAALRKREGEVASLQGTPVDLSKTSLPKTSSGNENSSSRESVDSGLPPPPVPPAPNVRPVGMDEPPGLLGTRSLPPPPVGSGQSGVVRPVDKNGKPVSTIVHLSLSDEVDGKNGKKKNKNVASYLPTGAFATAVLLSGMDAPTGGQAKTNPVPVLMRLMDEGQLPNFFHSEVDNCHVTGAAFGDLSSERAQIRLEVLTCVLVNGDIIEEPVAGYVAGEDGKAGMRGRLVSKQGAMIARSMLAGIASGIGSSVTQQYQQVSTSPLGNVTTYDPNKTIEAGLATGTANALEKIADYYIARANEMYPIIEVDANRIGEVILTGGTDLGETIIGNTRKSELESEL